MALQLSDHIGDVCTNGVNAPAVPIGDLLSAETLPKQSQHRQLSCGELCNFDAMWSRFQRYARSLKDPRNVCVSEASEPIKSGTHFGLMLSDMIGLHKFLGNPHREQDNRVSLARSNFSHKAIGVGTSFVNDLSDYAQQKGKRNVSNAEQAAQLDLFCQRSNFRNQTNRRFSTSIKCKEQRALSTTD